MAVDIPANSGTPIKAVAAGKVTDSGYSDINGNFVEIAHADGWRTKYRHLVEPTVVKVGAGVSQGQVIGRVGSTGWSTGPHLHFDLWNKDKKSPEAVYKSGIWAHDPELYLGKEEDDMLTKEEIEQMISSAIRHDNVQFRDEVNHIITNSHIRRDKRQAELEYALRVHKESPHSGGSTPEEIAEALKIVAK